MHWRQFLFVFAGRISRRQYWGFVAVYISVWLIPAIVDSKNGYEFSRGPLAACVILYAAVALFGSSSEAVARSGSVGMVDTNSLHSGGRPDRGADCERILEGYGWGK